MSPEEREQDKEQSRNRSRARFKDPAKRAAQTASKKRTAQRKIADGVCVSCNDLATCARYCFKHWLLSVGHKYGFTVKNGGVEALDALWKAQGGICALTGETLTPGHNASIDHILPRCRGGSDEVSNLQWVTKEINFFKRARTNEEVIALSAKITRHVDQSAHSNVTSITQLRRKVS